jgi:L-erythro-3,5-diaminohexanoate dehydrogenase
MAKPRRVETVSPTGIPADPFGSHRSLEPRGSLPQPAERIDNDFARLFTGELLIGVEMLNIDAASFRQMEEVPAVPAERGGDEGGGELGNDPVVARVQETIRARGKQHNPVTGSGGMLLGRILQLAPGRTGDTAGVGDRIATLVSLSLTPLRIDRVTAVRRESAQLDVEGEAVLFASGAYAKLPGDIPERLALAVLDIAGAAPQVARLVRRTVAAAAGKAEVSVLILGAGGKSGVLSAAEVRRTGGASVRILGVESHLPFADELRELGLCDEVIVADATDPLGVRGAVLAANGGREVDLSLSCVNVPDTEMSAILPVRERGTAYFFAMGTSFTRAALGAEGVSKDIDLVMGNGFARGHAEHSLRMMRTMPRIRALFERRYAG